LWYYSSTQLLLWKEAMIIVVLGGQYGSEGKGSVVSWLVRQFVFDLVVRTGSPNAGHIFKTEDNELFKMRQIASSWYYAKDTPIYIPAGAVVNKSVLINEVKLARENGYQAPIFVSPQASVIDEEAMKVEQAITTGTTGEGVGATRADKCLRRAKLVKGDKDFMPNSPLNDLFNPDGKIDEVQHLLSNPQKRILIEATQGFALSMDWEKYPYCTSTNLTTYRVLDDAEIPFGVHQVYPYLVLRTFPIRIAGSSGDLFNETSWQKLRERYGDHIPDEQTTVTKKTRRVGEWDSHIAREAVRRINPEAIFLTFVDYVFPELRQTARVTAEINHWLLHIEASIGRSISMLGVGIGDFVSRLYVE
jgi:adenylosuccinate synthase